MQLQGNRIIVKITEEANAIGVTCINPGELATQMPYEAGAEAVWSVYRGAVERRFLCRISLNW